MKKLIYSFLCMCPLSGADAQNFALQQLENSPRHHEWVKVKSGERDVNFK
jgi:carboxymethylenebutenolidase